MEQMDSIWIEDEPKPQVSKLYMTDPSIQVLNSDTPVLLNKKNIELPPLPPTSYFQQAIDEIEYNKKKTEKPNKLMGMFKKLSLNTEKTSPTKPKAVRKKISTPFDFNHISHVDHESPVSNSKITKMNPPPLPPKLEESPFEHDQMSPKSTTGFRSRQSSNAVAFNRTCPQVDSTPGRKLPRSISNATSLSSTAFTRSGSISTTATTISNARKNSSRLNSWNQSPKLNSSAKHEHSNSSSSIENLKKIEKEQITKQCSQEYTSKADFKYPTASFENWDTPDSRNVVRQSWVYDDLTPSPIKKARSVGAFIPPRHYLKRSNSFSHSPISPDSNSIDLNLFQNEMESSFMNKTELEYKKIIDSIDDFKEYFKNSIDEDDDLTSLIKRPNTTPLIPSPPSSNLSSPRRSSNNSNSTDETDDAVESLVYPNKKNFIKVENLNDDLLLSPSYHNLSDAESTPRQHHVSALLPSMI